MRRNLKSWELLIIGIGFILLAPYIGGAFGSLLGLVLVLFAVAAFVRERRIARKNRQV